MKPVRGGKKKEVLVEAGVQTDMDVGADGAQYAGDMDLFYNVGLAEVAGGAAMSGLRTSWRSAGTGWRRRLGHGLASSGCRRTTSPPTTGRRSSGPRWWTAA